MVVSSRKNLNIFKYKKYHYKGISCKHKKTTMAYDNNDILKLTLHQYEATGQT